MEAKKALEQSNGNSEAAIKYLREQGLASMAKRADRDNAQGAVAVATSGNACAIAQLRCETDFVAKSADFVALVQSIADTVAAKGEAAVADHKTELDTLTISLKENIELGRVVRFESSPGSVIDSYLHLQTGRGVNATMVEVVGGSQEVAHDIALHVAFARPQFLSRDDVPADLVASERATLEALSRNEGKPEAALPKIVEGRMNGFFKDRCLLEQEFAKDNKLSIKGVLGGATISRFAQIEIG